MHILTVNISQMVTDMTNICFHLMNLHLTLAHSTCQCQDYSHFDSEKFDKTKTCCISPYVSVYAALSCSYELQRIIYLYNLSSTSPAAVVLTNCSVLSTCITYPLPTCCRSSYELQCIIYLYNLSSTYLLP